MSDLLECSICGGWGGWRDYWGEWGDCPLCDGDGTASPEQEITYYAAVKSN